MVRVLVPEDDGPKGLFKAVREVLGGFACVQRCQRHKRENVVSYLAQKDQAGYRRLLQQAYQKADYGGAKSTLMEIHPESETTGRSAACFRGWRNERIPVQR